MEGYHGTNASEAVQTISTKDTGVVCQLIKTANVIATPMKKKTNLAVYYILAGDTSQVSSFFSWTYIRISKQYKIYLLNYLLHIGLIIRMLIIRKVIVHHPLFTAYVEIGNTLVAFKAKQ